METLFDWDEVTSLIHILRSQGILCLIGEDASPGGGDETIEPVQLIQRLASCGYPLVENAAISLFILHPEFAPAVVSALSAVNLTSPNISRYSPWLPFTCNNGGFFG